MTPSYPDYSQLRASGWHVNAPAGAYCVAWRGSEEVAFVWRHGRWQQVIGASRVTAA